MKKLLPFLLLISLSPIAMAEDTDSTDPFDDGVSGYIVGIDSGIAFTHYNDNALFQQTTKKNGYTGSAFLGYSFNAYFAFQTGFRLLPEAKGTFNGSTVRTMPFLIDGNLVARIPFYHHFDAVIKGGIAYVESTIKVTGQANSEATEYRPTFGLGMDYRITPNFTLTTGWTRVLAKGNAFDGFAQSTGATKLPLLDTFTTGLVYRF